MKTLKFIAVALVVTSVSFAQTKSKKAIASKPVAVTPMATPTAPIAAPAAVQAAPQTPSLLKWEKDTHEFGTVDLGKPVSYDFSFTNTSNKDITLTNVRASCGCTATNYTKTAIKPGEKGIVTATYNAASGGVFNKNVTVTTSEENAAPKIIVIKGTVKTNELPATVAPSK